MNDDFCQSALVRLFAEHGVTLEADEDWLLTEGDYPAVRATWHDGTGDAPGRLDLDVVPDEGRHIELGYAGAGRGLDGLRAALARFARGDLYVLLAACWYVTDDRRLDIGSWELGLRTWDAFLGRWSLDGTDAAPPPWHDALAEAARRTLPTPELHWVAIFVQREAGGAVRLECLLDGKPWAEAERALAALPWPEAAVAYSGGNLAVLDIRDY